MSKKESYWFSHDSNAASDPKLVALINKYGYEGYGHWWRLLERLRACDGYSYDISVPFAWEVLGQDLKITAAQAEAFVRDLVDYFQLLDCDGKMLWNSSMLERMEFWEKRKEVLRERGRKGGRARSKNKEEAQASNSLSTSKEQLKQNEAYYTKPNETILNETKQNQTTEVPKQHEDADDISKDKEQVMTTEEDTGFELLRRNALADGKSFVYPYVATGQLNKEQLGEWLTAFNTWLAFTGEEVKAERDYRRHFAAWFKYRDPQREDPKQYNPATTGKTLPRTEAPVQPLPQATAPPPVRSVPLPMSIPADKPKGRFSKGENRFDMYWLKNLRDEVRSMGG